MRRRKKTSLTFSLLFVTSTLLAPPPPSPHPLPGAAPSFRAETSPPPVSGGYYYLQPRSVVNAPRERFSRAARPREKALAPSRVALVAGCRRRRSEKEKKRAATGTSHRIHSRKGEHFLRLLSAPLPAMGGVQSSAHSRVEIFANATPEMPPAGAAFGGLIVEGFFFFFGLL